MAVPPGAASPPDTAQRNEIGPLGQLAVRIEEAAGLLAEMWNRDAPDASPVQLHALLIIERHRDINLSGLAAQLGALVSSASRLCDRLEAAGLLQRLPGPSRRAVTLRLSHEGAALLDRVRRQRTEDLGRVLARMPPGACAALAAGLGQFRTAAAKMAAGPWPGLSIPA
jgi:DNA-binding MarR family transcriptional regulator